jgi:hypothetical protein
LQCHREAIIANPDDPKMPAKELFGRKAFLLAHILLRPAPTAPPSECDLRA